MRKCHRFRWLVVSRRQLASCAPRAVVGLGVGVVRPTLSSFGRRRAVNKRHAKLANRQGHAEKINRCIIENNKSCYFLYYTKFLKQSFSKRYNAHMLTFFAPPGRSPASPKCNGSSSNYCVGEDTSTKLTMASDWSCWMDCIVCCCLHAALAHFKGTNTCTWRTTGTTKRILVTNIFRVHHPI